MIHSRLVMAHLPPSPGSVPPLHPKPADPQPCAGQAPYPSTIGNPTTDKSAILPPIGEAAERSLWLPGYLTQHVLHARRLLKILRRARGIAEFFFLHRPRSITIP
jgi:hypothetical protein